VSLICKSIAVSGFERLKSIFLFYKKNPNPRNTKEYA